MSAARLVPSPVNSPVSMSGSAEGIATRATRKPSPAPSVRATSMKDLGTDRTPARVIVAIGNHAPKATMKAADRYVVGTTSTARGNRALAGTGPTVCRRGCSQ